MTTTMTIREQINIDAPQTEVWKILGDLSTVQDYDGDVVNSFYLSEDREGVGASRQCDLRDGSYLRERVVSWDGGSGYAIEVYEDATDYPLIDQQATFALSKSGAKTTVTMTYCFGLKPGVGAEVEESMKAAAHELVRGLLENLKKLVETGERVETYPQAA